MTFDCCLASMDIKFYYRQLQDENRQLKTALEEHQTALELIMQRHRKLMLRIMQLSKKQAFAEQALSQLQQVCPFISPFKGKI